MNRQPNYVRLMKRLTQADGYIDLGMSSHALQRLENLGDLGPFTAAVAMLRGKALWIQHRFDEAVENLQIAAEGLRSPQARQAWLAISIYHRQRGHVDDAIEALSKARGVAPPQKRPRSRT